MNHFSLENFYQNYCYNYIIVYYSGCPFSANPTELLCLSYRKNTYRHCVVSVLHRFLVVLFDISLRFGFHILLFKHQRFLHILLLGKRVVVPRNAVLVVPPVPFHPSLEPVDDRLPFVDNDITHAGGGGLLLQHTTAAPQQRALVQSFRTTV